MSKRAESVSSDGRVRTLPVRGRAKRSPDGGARTSGDAWQRHFDELRSDGRARIMALASAAHDMKTPLATMAGYADLLQSGKLGTLDERQREVLREITANCSRLQRIVDDCLGFSMLEAGGVHLKVEEADLGGCLTELYGFWLSSFQKKGVALYLLPPPALPNFQFDYHKVQQSISNLLENALKFTPAGGTVWLSWEPHFWERRNRWERAIQGDRRRSDSTGSNAVRVCVCDTGPGIDPEYHQEIFEEFVRMPQGDRPAVGIGLGLAIARRLVLSHGGKIWVESELNAGSKFCLLLPLRQS
ncbi:MAG: sensor histidine kinase [Terriglobales bacterium]